MLPIKAYLYFCHNQIYKTMRKINVLILITLPLMFFSCGKTETHIITASGISLIEEFPFEGSNTLTGDWNFDFGTIDVSKVKNARVKRVKMSMVEPETTNGIEEVTIQLAASGASMQKVAVLNPVSQGEQHMTPSVAEKQKDILNLLKQGKITFVADINIREDMDVPLSLVAELEFELEVKQ